MSWDTGRTSADVPSWDPAPAGGDDWGGGSSNTRADAGADGGADDSCRICKQSGHYARDCPSKPEGNGGLTGECFNCGQVGHNKADCTNERVQRPFGGICKLCDQPGHRAMDCKSRRTVDWSGVPEMDAEAAWVALIDAAKAKDFDVFRVCLKAYARATMDQFDLPAVEQALREDGIGIYLIAKKEEIPINMTIVDLTGNPDREYVLTFQLSPKPRRARLAQGWPESPAQNMERLRSCGDVKDRGIPLCGNCGELGHIRKHCKQEQVERQTHQPEIQCVNCKEIGHRSRDCTKERFNPFACRNCKQEGHNARDCPEPRSAEGVECRKCNETGHFSKDCPNVAARTCRNCGSTEHMAKECDQPRNPDTVICRNCEQMGHFSRDCPEPKDWSKHKCSNCGELGHGLKRCKAPIADSNDNGGGDGGGGWGGDTGDSAAAATGEASWNDGGNGGW